MKDTKAIKLMIIENYIDWFTTNEEEREQMKADASLYVEEDHVDEIEQSPQDHREELEKQGYCLGSIWQIADVQSRFICDDETAREIMNDTLENEAVMNQVWESMEIIATIDYELTYKD